MQSVCILKVISVKSLEMNEESWNDFFGKIIKLLRILMTLNLLIDLNSVNLYWRPASDSFNDE